MDIDGMNANSTDPNDVQMSANLITKAVLNTYIPKGENFMGSCNYNTCQLGKCLKNGTCECVHPAVGKYCDQIDECLVLKCVHGHCVTGKGCLCEKGFSGSTCEVKLRRRMKNKFNSEYKANQTVIKTKIASVEDENSLLITPTTITPTLSDLTESSTTTPTTTTSSSTTTTTTTTTTSEIITSCENGGLFIDNICICLNQFTGKQCEIAPQFEETTEINKDESESSDATQSASTVTSSPSTPHSSNKKGHNEQIDLEDGLIPVFTFNRLSRFKSNESSLIEPRNIYWPWFGNLTFLY